MDAFGTLFGNSGHRALLLTPDQTVLEATTLARRLFNLASEGPVPLPRFPSAVEVAIEQASQGMIARLDIQHSDPEGINRTFELIVQPIEMGGVVAAILLHAYDVTERRHTEREGHLLSHIALAVGQTENVNLAVVVTLKHICDATGWVLGEAWIPRVEAPSTQVLERRGIWSIPDAQLDAFTAQGSGLRFRAGEGIPGTAWASGKYIWVNDLRNSPLFTRGALAALAGLRAAVAIPLIYTAGEVVAVLVFLMRDVHADNEELVQLASAVAAPLAQLLRQKQVEEAHRIAEARFTGMVSIASDAIISIDSERRITLFNWGAERIFGYSTGEVMRQLIDILLPENLRSRHAAHIVGFATSSQATRRMGERSRIVGLRKNGELFPAEASISRFLTAGEWVYTVILRDVSESVRTEEELRILAERMRKAAASRDEVMALVSHDLRNPLNTISICLSGLRDDPPPPAAMADGLVVLAQESVTLMSRMIQDLLDVASIDAGKLSLEQTAQPLGPILRRAVDMHSMLAAEQQIALLLDNALTGDQPIVNIDGERIVQALSNLIGNACKFTEPGGRITISALRFPDAVQVTVRDTGRGISLDAIPHIFDRFWYAQRGSAQRSTGLGLAIARGIVEAHGGRISVESTVGEGSAFLFTIPLPEIASEDPETVP